MAPRRTSRPGERRNPRPGDHPGTRGLTVPGMLTWRRPSLRRSIPASGLAPPVPVTAASAGGRGPAGRGRRLADLTPVLITGPESAGRPGAERAWHPAHRPASPEPVLRRPDQRPPLGRRPAPRRRPHRPHRTPGPAPRAGSPGPGLPPTELRGASRLGHRPPYPPLEPAGGATSLDDLALFCHVHHHYFIHILGWIITGNPNGTLHFTHPGGWLTLESPLPRTLMGIGSPV